MRSPPDPEVLVDAALKKLGLSNKTQKQQVIELERVFHTSLQQSSLSRWRRGGGFRYQNTMLLLDAAGWLNRRAIAAAERDAARKTAREGGQKAIRLVDNGSPAQGERRRESGS